MQRVARNVLPPLKHKQREIPVSNSNLINNQSAVENINASQIPFAVEKQTHIRSSIKNLFTKGIKSGFAGKECCAYILFMILFINICIMSRSWADDIYFASKALKKQLIDFDNVQIESTGENFYFDQIIDIPHLWMYIEQILIPSMLIETYDNGENITNQQFRYTVGGYGHARILGGIRLKIYKVKSSICNFEAHKFDCYENSKENTSSISVLFPTDDDIEIFEQKIIHHQTRSELNEAPLIFGLSQFAWPSNGFPIILPLNKDHATAIVKGLRNSTFIDGNTRVLSIDYCLFNPSFKTHTTVRLFFGITAAGGVEKRYSIQTFQFLPYHSTRGKVFLALQIIFAFGVVVYTVVDIRQIIKSSSLKIYLLYEIWNIVDILAIIMYWITIISTIVLEVNAAKIDFFDINRYQSFMYHVWLFQFWSICLSISGGIMCLRVFKYFAFSSRLTFLFRMLYVIIADLLIFLLVLSIILFAFAFAGYLMFSSSVYEFRSLTYSLMNCFIFLISGLNFKTVGEFNNLFGVLFYLIFGITISLMLANVFVAILVEGYILTYHVKESKSEVSNELEDVMPAVESIVEKKSDTLQEFDEASNLFIDYEQENEKVNVLKLVEEIVKPLIENMHLNLTNMIEEKMCQILVGFPSYSKTSSTFEFSNTSKTNTESSNLSISPDPNFINTHSNEGLNFF